MRRSRDYLTGLLILLGGPLAVIAALWAWTAWSDATPDQGSLLCATGQTLAWEGAKVPQTASFSPSGGGAVPVPVQPTYLLVMVDVSGSTDDSRAELVNAVISISNDLLGASPANRVAVVSFETGATLQADWTQSRTAVAEAARRLLPLGGENSSKAAFDLAISTVGTADPNAKRIVVFYTDGEIDSCRGGGCPPVFDWDDIARAGARLRATGADVFVVGTPGYLRQDMKVVTGSEARLLQIDNQREILGQLRTMLSIADNAGPHGILSTRVDGRLFDVAVTDPRWTAGTETVSREVSGVPAQAAEVTYGLMPKVLGVLPLTLSPAKLSYLGGDGQMAELRCRVRDVLVVSPLFLLLVSIPALAWTVLCLVPPPRDVRDTPVGLPDPSPPPSTAVLRFPPAEPVRGSVVPTLFIGLGGWGGDAVRAAQREMRHAHAGESAPPPYSYLIIDLDADAAKHDAGVAAPVRTVIAPNAVTDVYGYIDEAARGGCVYAGLGLLGYRNAGREKLNLATGSRGDRVLARTALLRWLRSGELSTALRGELEALLKQPSANGVRQVVLMAHAAGGFGGAVLLDVARILRRQARDLQSDGQFIPEFIAVAGAGVLGDSDRRRRAAFLRENATTRAFGRYPRRVVLAEGDPVLDRVDAEAPLDTMLIVDGEAKESCLEAGLLSGVLADGGPRRALMAALEQTAGSIATVQATEVAVRRAHVRDLVAEEFLLRIVATHLLGGVRPAAAGAVFEIAPVSPGGAEQALRICMADEPPTSPWRLLLEAALDPARVSAFLDALAPIGDANLEWMSRAAAQSISRGFAIDPARQRQMTPGIAAAALRLLAERIRGPLKIDAGGLGASAAMLDMLAALAGRFDALADGFDAWSTELLAAMDKVWHDKQQRLRDTEPATPHLTELGHAVNDATVDRWLADSYAACVGARTGDAAGFGERINFAVIIDGDALVPIVRTRIGERADFRSTGAALNSLANAAQMVAGLVPAMYVDSAIAGLEPAARQGAANAMTRGGSFSDALLVRPVASDERSGEALAAFAGDIVEPIGMRARHEAVGGDRSAVRRIAWSAPAGTNEPRSPPVVQPIDLAAEALRRRIDAFLDRAIGPLPIGLALAAASPDGLRAFAVAYRNGHLQRRPDMSGQMSWFLAGANRFITAGGTLSDAAAAFVADDRLAAVPYDPIAPGGDFTPLQELRDGARDLGQASEADLLALAAIAIALEDR